jgi:hypothetical protein
MSSRFKSSRVQIFDALPPLNLEPDTPERELKNPRSQERGALRSGAGVILGVIKPAAVSH